jgi:hypothetical protein
VGALEGLGRNPTAPVPPPFTSLGLLCHLAPATLRAYASAYANYASFAARCPAVPESSRQFGAPTPLFHPATFASWALELRLKSASPALVSQVHALVTHLFTIGMLPADMAPRPLGVIYRSLAAGHCAKTKPLIPPSLVMEHLSKPVWSLPHDVVVLLCGLLSGLRKSDLKQSYITVTGPVACINVMMGKNRCHGRVVPVSCNIVPYYKAAARNYDLSGAYTIHSGRCTWASIASVYGCPQEFIMMRLGHLNAATLSHYVLPFTVDDYNFLCLKHVRDVLFLHLFTPMEREKLVMVN